MALNDEAPLSWKPVHSVPALRWDLACRVRRERGEQHRRRAACGAVPPIEITATPIPPDDIPPQPNATLQKIVISGDSSSYALGTTTNAHHGVGVQALGVYSDLTVRAVPGLTWTSSDPTIASVQQVSPVAIQVQAHRVGVVTITATAGQVSTSGCFVVTSPVVSELVISAPSSTMSNANGLIVVNPGDTVPITCTEIMTDGSKADVTTEVAWVSFDTAIATISPTGTASALSPGYTTITVSPAASCRRSTSTGTRVPLMTARPEWMPSSTTMRGLISVMARWAYHAPAPVASCS